MVPTSIWPRWDKVEVEVGGKGEDWVGYGQEDREEEEEKEEEGVQGLEEDTDSAIQWFSTIEFIEQNICVRIFGGKTPYKVSSVNFVPMMLAVRRMFWSSRERVSRGISIK